MTSDSVRTGACAAGKCRDCSNDKCECRCHCRGGQANRMEAYFWNALPNWKELPQDIRDQEEAERRLWDQTLMDGLENEPTWGDHG